MKKFVFIALLIFQCCSGGVVYAEQNFDQSESVAADRRFFLFLVDATDGITPETGEAAGQPQISINGAAYSNTSATLVSVGNGTYYVVLTTAELATEGKFIVRYKSANTVEFQDIGVVNPRISDEISSVKRMLNKIIRTTNDILFKVSQDQDFESTNPEASQQ